MAINEAIIIGGGIAGVAAAIALTKFNHFKVAVFEIRPEPATIGGAINLTPNALRYLEHLGVKPKLQLRGCEVNCIQVLSHRTGQPLGTVDFANIEPHALRVMRFDLLQAMLETLRELDVQVQYSKRLIAIEEDVERITATFEGGMIAKGELLLGCDGIHSVTRTKFIQPARKPEYTGVANAYSFLNIEDDVCDMLPIDTTSLYSGRHGSLLLSYADPAHRRLYVSAVMATADVGSREGWTVKRREQDALKADLVRRFGHPSLPFFETILQKLEAITLYPVYKLSESGVWSSGKMILVGDAAHAMPPQGESVGLALEDVILLSRILEHHQIKSIGDMFNCYDTMRRPRIDAAVKEANFGFETIKDRGWLGNIIMDWLTWFFLAWRQKRKSEEFSFDVRHNAIVFN
ncbi:putative salicylate hydroxylase [Polyplosphaeria fusca]|uniref:Salicylate hydroxylase n=1 Tax=Polyplosphaeria fusca TaxID=682080 RepID=A0A9P4RB26_9PLEO|nr:putative salicylate hydroxylase [Polyplosphaeria fusca]